MSIELIFNIYPESEGDRFCFQFFKQTDRLGSFQYLLVGCKIVRGGILHLSRQYSNPLTLQECQNEIESHGSPHLRPYLLGQQWDGECEACVMALFYSACNAFNLDPLVIYNAAYPVAERDDKLQQGDVEADIHLAEWQGVHYPDWNAAQIKQLFEALEEINLHNLIVAMRQALESRSEEKRNVFVRA